MIAFDKTMQDYEVRHWTAHRNHTKRYGEYLQRMDDTLHISSLDAGSVVDVGCGPNGGVFGIKQFPVMYGVDPLWSRYAAENLVRAPDKVHTVDMDARSFVLPAMCDAAVSVNALDHSGDIVGSIRNIMKWVSAGGQVVLHVHLRTKKQLNAGHQMIVDADVVRAAVEEGCDIARFDIYDIDPLQPGKKYKALVVGGRKI